MNITVETLVKSDLNTAWAAWNNPEDVKQWNAASDDWHTTQSTVDLRGADGVLIKETFDAESETDQELQRQGWQAILDNFVGHVEAKNVSGAAGN